MSNKIKLKDALEMNDDFFKNNQHLIECKIITAYADALNKAREALLTCKSEQGFMNDQMAFDYDLVQQTLAATDPERILLP